ARRAGNGDVVVRQVDVDRFDRFHRHRLAAGGHVVAFKTEGIAGGHAVDADRVVARVLTTGTDRARSAVDERNARIETHEVLDVAADRRQRLDRRLVDAGARTDLG